MDRDETYRRLINSTRWRRLRAWRLRAQPLCVRCMRSGLIRSATEVHHIVPVESGSSPAMMERLAYDPANLEGLCHACHAETHRELKKGSAEVRRERVRREVEEFTRRMLGGDDAGE